MQPAAQVLPVAPPQGVFATIAGSLSGVLVAPSAMLIPVLTDLFLWLGVRLSPAALTGVVSDAVRHVESLDRETALRVTDRLSTFGDITPVIALFAPSLLAGVTEDSVQRSWQRAEYQPASAALVALELIGLLIVSVGISAIFRVWLAREIRSSSQTLSALVPEIVRAWARYLGFMVLVVIAVLAAIPVLAAVAALMLILGLNVGPMLILLVIPPVLLVALLLAFVPDAIVLRRVGPIRAALLSAQVVRRHMLPSLGFLAVSALTLSGLSLVLSSFLANTVGVVTAIVIYGFVTTGLTRAQLQFFFDRLSTPRKDGAITATVR